MWRFLFIKLCFVWAGVVSFELAHPGLNPLPGVSLSPSAKWMVLIGLRFWNQALMHLPSTFSNELLSEPNCKVNLIHAQHEFYHFLGNKEAVRGHITMLLTCLPHLSPPSLVLFLVLSKLIGPLCKRLTPISNTAPLADSYPHSSPIPDCVYCSAPPALGCCVFHSWHLGLVPASQQWDLCIIYATATGKWRWGWSREKANSGVCDENPKQQCFQLNRARLTEALEIPTCAHYFADSIQPKLLSAANISMREIILVAYSIVLQEPCLQDQIFQSFYWQSCSLLCVSPEREQCPVMAEFNHRGPGQNLFLQLSEKGILCSIPFLKGRDFYLNWAIMG